VEIASPGPDWYIPFRPVFASSAKAAAGMRIPPVRGGISDPDSLGP